MQLLSDGNGIYVSGAGTGNIIRYNYLHDNQAHCLPAAIRCDDEQHETLIHGKILYQNRGHAAAIASKGVNDITNNCIVDQTAVPRKGQTSGRPKLESTEMDFNLYYHPTDSHWMDGHLLKMRAVGKEKSSCVGDPLFVAPAGGDFRFRPNSPALALGIEPLDVSKMGRLKRN